ncbi:MAG: hypothetical protein WCP97_01715 [bacterium]
MKIFRFFVLVILVLSFSVASASDWQNQIILNQLKNILTIPSGRKAFPTVSVFNDSTETLSFVTDFLDCVKNDDGALSCDLTNQPGITFSDVTQFEDRLTEERFVIAPGEAKLLQLGIGIPSDFVGDALYGRVRFSTRRTSPSGQLVDFELFSTFEIVTKVDTTPTATASPPSSVTSRDGFFADNFEAEWVSQTQPKNALTPSFLPPTGYFELKEKESVLIGIVMKNVGKETWKKGDVTFAIYKDMNVFSAPAGLGYDDPTNANFGKSYFFDSTWLSEYRIGTLNETIVKPGENGTFSLLFRAPDYVIGGSYREDISLAAGKYWIKNTKNGDSLHVAHVWVGLYAKVQICCS